MNHLAVLFFLVSGVGGGLILFDYDDAFAQSTEFRLPSLTFSNQYSYMPTYMQDSLSELDEINVDSKVDEIIRPTFQNPLEKPVTKDNDDI